ncbi:unnamed protein product [Ixodes pacificus]
MAAITTGHSATRRKKATADTDIFGLNIIETHKFAIIFYSYLLVRDGITRVQLPSKEKDMECYVSCLGAPIGL